MYGLGFASSPPTPSSFGQSGGEEAGSRKETTGDGYSLEDGASFVREWSIVHLGLEE